MTLDSLSTNEILALNEKAVAWLKENAPNINAYIILQVGSIKGINFLCERHGLEVQEVVSAGSMDVDILYEHSKKLQYK